MRVKATIEAVAKNIEFHKIDLDKDNRMVRLGVGRHDGKWFVRADLWFAGFRLNQRDYTLFA
jgi:hypothetical protein